jgi:hypothetical protein
VSALIAVAKGDCIEMLTDAVCINAHTGAISGLVDKQFNTLPGVMIGISGEAETGRAFSYWAGKRCRNHDELVTHAADIWKASYLPSSAVPSVAFCGYSVERQGLELWSIMAGDDGFIASNILVASPADNDGEAVAPFVERFAADPESFDAARDGVGLMQTLRGYRRRFGNGRPVGCVGGWVQHSVVRRDGIERQVIHVWHDRVGAVIENAA